ncbi:MAG: M42 family peptidase, partial [Candidatus Micrarchaeota archaeon]
MGANIGLLKELCEAFGVPGYENEVAKIMKRELAKHCKEVNVDRMGNVVARRIVNPKKPVLMLGAHMDEIGMMVKTINEKGFLRFMKIGGIDDRVLLNQRVVLNTARGKIYGVIGSKPPHLQKEEDMKKIVEVKSMFIDIGAKDRKDAERMGVRVGDPIGFDVGFRELANGLVTGKALDDRIGCYVLLELARRAPRDVNLIFVGTVQEEVSTYGKGAMVSAYRETPHYFVALDTCIASDHPECAEDENPV